MPTDKRTWIEVLKQLLLLNMAATVIAVVFNVANYGAGNFSVQEFVSSFVYSNCIGTYISVIIFYLSPRWDKNPKIIRLAKVFISFFITTFLGVVTARFILNLFFPSFAVQNLIPGWRTLVFSLGMGFTFGFAFYFYEISQTKLRRKELDEEKARTLASEAQLASLESKIHPHFLFNTLNSIASLIREEPVLAEKMIEKLSSLLRYSLDSTTNNIVSLGQELEITEKYLEIEKIRFQHRLEYEISVDEAFLRIKLPPLSLQTLVENSIKHVASTTSKPTRISISARENDTAVIIDITDNGPGFDPNAIREGHGLDILQKRLAAIFQKTAGLEFPEKSTVRLKLPK